MRRRDEGRHTSTKRSISNGAEGARTTRNSTECELSALDTVRTPAVVYCTGYYCCHYLSIRCIYIYKRCDEGSENL